MKRVLLFLILGSLAVASAAQENNAGNSVEVRGSQITIPARAYPMFPNQLDAYAGTYNLSNGEVMHLSRAAHRLVAQVGKRAPQELVAASSNEFVALDRQLRITLNEDDSGDMNGELLMMVPRPTASTGSGVEAKLFSLR